MKKKVINRAIVVIFLVIFGATMFLKDDFLKLNIEQPSEIFLVKKGDNLRRISEEFNFNGYYNKPKVMFFVMRVFIGNQVLHAGEYEIIKGETIFGFIQKLKAKTQYYRKITFVEGEMALTYKEQLEQAFGLEGGLTEYIKEGYFMPGTYNYLYGETKNSIARRAKEEMLKFSEEEFAKVKSPTFYLKNIHDVITLASVVEKESGINMERALIAGVFYNRLEKGMRLQSDPTTIYEITKGKFQLKRKLTYEDLKIKGEYNTYTIKGIPAGPIASPGREAIIAVLQPKKTNSLFFVADGYGGHTFSEDFEEHKNNIKVYKKVLSEKNER